MKQLQLLNRLLTMLLHLRHSSMSSVATLTHSTHLLRLTLQRQKNMQLSLRLQTLSVTQAQLLQQQAQVLQLLTQAANTLKALFLLQSSARYPALRHTK